MSSTSFLFSATRRPRHLVAVGSGHKQAGMTLVEVMVASVVFAMVMLATITAMRTFATSYERIVAAGAEANVLREVSHFLRESLRNAVAESSNFRGDKRQLMWLAPLDRAGSAGGLQHMRLRRQGDELILSFAPYDSERPQGEEPPWGDFVADYPLIRDVQRFELAYKMEADSAWVGAAIHTLADGNEADQVPWEIRISIETSSSVWPPILVHPDAVVVER